MCVYVLASMYACVWCGCLTTCDKTRVGAVGGSTASVDPTVRDKAVDDRGTIDNG